ncbi:MAG: hypothetical protein QF918_05270 [Pirellulaceae bacterium]|jgi:hypothetical protein|nr:hypothetical protein [Pirellulaceae bacterium]MDP6557195.1 hypothetical protein [Pirellulaceae bacterium]MDP6718427.1 hypothetical protein [Pirellulaceae bacterium]
MDVQPPLVWFVILGVGVLFLLFMLALIVMVLWLAFRRKPVPPPAKSLDRSIDVATLDASGAPAGLPQLEYYGCPVRLAVLILAPVGRDGSIPEKEQLPELFEQFVPHFLQVVAAHRPLLHFWPAQVSTAGFANSFFGNVALPGNRGKGTPWCAMAGRFTALGGQYLAGIVCCGNEASGLGQLAIEQEGQWRDVLRVKN